MPLLGKIKNSFERTNIHSGLISGTIVCNLVHHNIVNTLLLVVCLVFCLQSNSRANDDEILEQIREQYRISAEMDNPKYDYEILAGAGFQGNRDGKGVYALFNNPTDITFGDDPNFLYVLDSGNSLIRRIDIENKRTTTVYDFKGLSDTMISKLLVFKDFIILSAIDKIIKIDSKYPYADNPLGDFLPINTILSNEQILDIKRYGDSILCLTMDKVIKYNTASNSWDLVLNLKDKYDYLFTDNDTLFIVAISSKNCLLYDMAKNEVASRFTYDRSVNHIVADNYTNRYIIVSEGKLFYTETNPQNMSKTSPLPFVNIHAHSINIDNATFEYRKSFIPSISNIVKTRCGNDFYVVDSDNDRIIKMRNNFFKRPIYKSDGYVPPIYAPVKPKGINRLIWLGHSVYWCPDGSYYTNVLDMGTPRLLESLLNSNRDLSGYWEIIRPDLVGINMYPTLNDIFKDTVSAYGSDYVLMTLDLNTFAYLVFYSWHGWPSNPPKYDSTGFPISNGRKFDKLDEFLRDSLKKDKNQPFFTPDGMNVNSQFYRLWMERADFRNIVIDMYIDIISNIKAVCDKNKIEFFVIIVPTSNFFSSVEFNSGQGGEEKRYSFEDAHSPILAALYKKQIKAYDVSYEMIRRYIKYFPYDAPSHHRSYLFHQALAESIEEVLLRNNLISKVPLSSRTPEDMK